MFNVEASSTYANGNRSVISMNDDGSLSGTRSHIGNGWSCQQCNIMNTSERSVCHECGCERYENGREEHRRAKRMTEEKQPATQTQRARQKFAFLTPSTHANNDLEEHTTGSDAHDSLYPTSHEFELTHESDPVLELGSAESERVASLPPIPQLDVPELRPPAIEMDQVVTLANPSTDATDAATSTAALSHPLHHPDVLQLPHTHLSVWKWQHIVLCLSPATPITDWKRVMIELHAGLERSEPTNTETDGPIDPDSPQIDTRILGVDAATLLAQARQASNPNNVRSSPTKHPWKRDSSVKSPTGKSGANKGPAWITSFSSWLSGVSEAQRTHFYTSLVPFLCKLVLALPLLFPADSPIHVLRAGKSGTRHLSVEQCACLLATGFLGLHLERQPQYQWTTLNHAKLFLFLGDVGSLGHAQENKLRCLLNYFALVRRELYPQGLSSSHNLPAFTPTGRIVTFHRRCLLQEQQERFTVQRLALSGVRMAPIRVEHKAPIEDGPAPHAHVVFATHRILGSGALNRSASSEEIRLLSSPEALCLVALTEALEPHESFLVSGARRFSEYLGFGKSFSFHGSAPVEQPEIVQLSIGERKRIRNTMIFLDAMQYDQSDIAKAGVSKHSAEQYQPHLMLRETLKAFAGFSLPVSPSPAPAAPSKPSVAASSPTTDAPPVPSSSTDDASLGGFVESSLIPEVIASAADLFSIHTGAWGCGHHGGDLQLKVLLQWIAASLTKSGDAPAAPLMETNVKRGKKSSKPRTVSRTTLTGNLTPEEWLAVPPPRSLVIHLFADPRAAGLEHFLDFISRHPLGGVTEWSDDSATNHGLTVGKVWIALMTYAEEIQKKDGPIIQALKKEQRERQGNTTTVPTTSEGGDPSSTFNPAVPSALTSPARKLPPGVGRGPVQTSSSMAPTTVNRDTNLSHDLYLPTLSVFQYLERYFDHMWQQVEHKKSMACQIL